MDTLTTLIHREDAFAESLASWSSQRIDGDEWLIAYEGGEILFTREPAE